MCELGLGSEYSYCKDGSDLTNCFVDEGTPGSCKRTSSRLVVDNYSPRKMDKAVRYARYR